MASSNTSFCVLSTVLFMAASLVAAEGGSAAVQGAQAEPHRELLLSIPLNLTAISKTVAEVDLAVTNLMSSNPRLAVVLVQVKLCLGIVATLLKSPGSNVTTLDLAALLSLLKAIVVTPVSGCPVGIYVTVAQQLSLTGVIATLKAVLASVQGLLGLGGILHGLLGNLVVAILQLVINLLNLVLKVAVVVDIAL